MPYNEITRVQIPALMHLAELGYDFISQKNKPNLDTATNILTDSFTQAFERLNPTKNAKETLAEIKKRLKSGVENKIIRHLVNERLVYGVVCMPSQVFANTGTNVSIIFFKKTPSEDEVILIDASKLGEEYTENKNKKTRLRTSDMDLILETFQNKTPKADFCALVSFDEIVGKNYSLNPGQYFTIEDTSEKISQAEFENLMQQYSSELASLFDESQSLQQEILETLKGVRFE